jgi:Tfp pilus assembly protein PilF/4-amino-4-deoxy-L-arabinose transferase-like glycosyltransferase
MARLATRGVAACLLDFPVLFRYNLPRMSGRARVQHSNSGSPGWLAPVLAALVCAAIFLPTLRYQFVWDDEQLVTANQRLYAANPLSLFGQGFMPESHGSAATRVHYYRPLTVLTFWLDRHIWGWNPFGYHLTNVLLNASALVLLGLLLGRLAGRKQVWPVLLGVAVFGLHPAHVESVAFISGRTDLLATVFVLLCLLSLRRYDRSGRWPWLGAATASAAAAMLAKETAVLLPLLVVAMLYRPGFGKRARNRFAVILPAAAVLACLVLRWLVLRSAALPAGTAGPVQRLLLFLNALGRYGQLAVFPFTHRLQYLDLAAFAAFNWPTVVGLLLLVSLPWLAWRFRGRAPGFGAAWFLLFILPASNLFAIGDTFLAERLLCLSLAGVAIIALAVARIRPGTGRNVIMLLLFSYVGLMGVGAVRRMPVWRDPVTLFRTMVRESPGSADARVNLGAALLRQENDARGAEDEFRMALALQPDRAVAHYDLGDILRMRGQVDSAVQEYRAAIRLDPGYAEAHGNLGIILLRAGQPDSAFDELRLARALNPDLAPVYVSLGNCFVARGQPDSALRSFWTAIRLQPDRPEAYINLNRLYTLLGKFDSAELAARMLQQHRAPTGTPPAGH